MTLVSTNIGTFHAAGVDYSDDELEPDETTDELIPEPEIAESELEPEIATEPKPNPTSTTSTRRASTMAPPKKTYTLKKISEISKVPYPVLAKYLKRPDLQEAIAANVVGEGKGRQYLREVADVFKDAYANRVKGKPGRKPGSGAAKTGGELGTLTEAISSERKKPGPKPGSGRGRKPGRPADSGKKGLEAVREFAKASNAPSYSNNTLLSRVEALEKASARVDEIEDIREEIARIKESIGL